MIFSILWNSCDVIFLLKKLSKGPPPPPQSHMITTKCEKNIFYFLQFFTQVISNKIIK